MSSAMYVKVNSILEDLKNQFPNGNALGLLYMWDIIRDVFTDIEGAIEGDSSWGDLIPVPGTTLEDVFNKFEKDVWGGFDVSEYDVLDWLSAEDLIQEWEDQDGEDA